MTEVLAVNSEFQSVSDIALLGESAADPHLSIAEAARSLRISPTTLRRHIKDYSDHVDVTRKGRLLMVAVSSIPSLALIRDLRAQRFSADDIRQVLRAAPGQAILASQTAAIEASTRAAVNIAVDDALKDIRAELKSIKATSRDSDIVVRQSLANILFLIDKFGKELQFHASEERIANIERDLLLMQSEMSLKQLPKPPAKKIKKGLLANAVSFYRRLSTTFL